ncbi:MAG TPA: ATP-binding cassette domain-containing protein, partial [Actinotalea sp.]|nr:ATP-binding cassette domain-containing protein [Actinotalea sp.]
MSLIASGLVVRYGRHEALAGVDVSLEPGRLTALLGPNGAGKTTSFRMTTGQIPPNEGKVIFNGQDVTRLPMFRRARLGMGYLSQEPSIFRKLTVEKNLLA